MQLRRANAESAIIASFFPASHSLPSEWPPWVVFDFFGDGVRPSCGPPALARGPDPLGSRFARSKQGGVQFSIPKHSMPKQAQEKKFSAPVAAGGAVSSSGTAAVCAVSCLIHFLPPKSNKHTSRHGLPPSFPAIPRISFFTDYLIFLLYYPISSFHHCVIAVCLHHPCLLGEYLLFRRPVYLDDQSDRTPRRRLGSLRLPPQYCFSYRGWTIYVDLSVESKPSRAALQRALTTKPNIASTSRIYQSYIRRHAVQHAPQVALFTFARHPHPRHPRCSSCLKSSRLELGNRLSHRKHQEHAVVDSKDHGAAVKRGSPCQQEVKAGA